MKGWERSKRYFEEALLPLIRKQYPAMEQEMAVGVLGMGSDAAGLDDELHRQGLAQIYYPSSGAPKITEEWFYFLYDAAVDLYRSIPEPLVYKHFNDVDWRQHALREI